MRGLVFGLFLAAVSQLAWGQSGPYVGGGIGSSQVEIGPFDESDTGYQLFAGYRFREGGLPLTGTLGIEVGYMDLGAPEGTVLGETVEVEVDALKVYVTASKPFGERWALLGKIGAVAWDEAVRVPGLSGSTDDTDLAAAIGFEFKTAQPSLSIRGEIEGFDFHDGVWLYSVSAIFRFGARDN